MTTLNNYTDIFLPESKVQKYTESFQETIFPISCELEQCLKHILIAQYPDITFELSEPNSFKVPEHPHMTFLGPSLIRLTLHDDIDKVEFYKFAVDNDFLCMCYNFRYLCHPHGIVRTLDEMHMISAVHEYATNQCSVLRLC